MVGYFNAFERGGKGGRGDNADLSDRKFDIVSRFSGSPRDKEAR